jgi:hypothetical protein
MASPAVYMTYLRNNRRLLPLSSLTAQVIEMRSLQTPAHQESKSYNTRRMRVRISILGCALALAGCGLQSSMNCSPNTFTLSAVPASEPAVEPDHAAPPPGNQEQFSAFLTPTSTKPGCALPQYIAKVQATWAVSDPADVAISSAAATNGLATCLHATPKPVILTASYAQNGVTETAITTMSCK